MGNGVVVLESLNQLINQLLIKLPCEKYKKIRFFWLSVKSTDGRFKQVELNDRVVIDSLN